MKLVCLSFLFLFFLCDINDDSLCFSDVIATAKTPELAVFNEKHLIPRFIGISKNGDTDLMTIEDVSSSFKAPCAVDIKMGTQTWQPGCKEEYRVRKLKQDALCTTKTYGFRFSGACFPDATYGHDFGWYANSDAQMLECLRAILQCVPSSLAHITLPIGAGTVLGASHGDDKHP